MIYIKLIDNVVVQKQRSSEAGFVQAHKGVGNGMIWSGEIREWDTEEPVMDIISVAVLDEEGNPVLEDGKPLLENQEIETGETYTQHHVDDSDYRDISKYSTPPQPAPPTKAELSRKRLETDDLLTRMVNREAKQRGIEASKVVDEIMGED